MMAWLALFLQAAWRRCPLWLGLALAPLAAAAPVHSFHILNDVKYKAFALLEDDIDLGTAGPHMVVRPGLARIRTRGRFGLMGGLMAAIPVGRGDGEGLEFVILTQYRLSILRPEAVVSPVVAVGARMGVAKHELCGFGGCLSWVPTGDLSLIVAGEVRPANSQLRFSVEGGMDMSGPFGRVMVGFQAR